MSSKEAVSLQEAFKRCELYYGGEKIPYQDIMEAYMDFVAGQMDMDRHAVGCVSSIQQRYSDGIIIFLAGVDVLLRNPACVEDVIGNLQPGQVVIYNGKKPERLRFRQVDTLENGEKRIVLFNEKQSLRRLIPWRFRYLIEPYEGKAKSLGGKGLKKETGQLDGFCSAVLGMARNRITRATEISSVLVLPKERVEEAMDNLSIIYHVNGEDHEAHLLDLFTAAWFTMALEPVDYPGNPGKLIPMLQFTGTVATARSLLFSKDWNETRGVAIVDPKAANRGQSELEDLMDYQRLGYVIIDFGQDYLLGDDLHNMYEEANALVVTRAFCRESGMHLVLQEDGASKELSERIGCIRNNTIEVIPSGDVLTLEQSKGLERGLANLRRLVENEPVVKDFLKQAYSLLKIFNNEIVGWNRDEDVDTIKDDFSFLREIYSMSSGTIQKIEQELIGILSEYYHLIEKKHPKRGILQGLVKWRWSRIAVVVPTRDAALRMRKRYIRDGLDFVAWRDWGKGEWYDIAIFTGCIPMSKGNFLFCPCASKIQVLLYRHEEGRFRRLLRKKADMERTFDDWMGISHSEADDAVVIGLEDVVDEDNCEDDGYDYEFTQADVAERRERLSEEVSRLNRLSGGQQKQKVVKHVHLMDGRSAFLSQEYQAYVYGAEGIEQIGVDELEEEMRMLFLKDGNERKDVVKSIFLRMRDAGQLPDDVRSSYMMVRQWKGCLKQYMHDYGYSYEDIAREFGCHGYKRLGVSIASWLDDAGHVVGPRDNDQSGGLYRVMGEITNTHVLRGSPEAFSKATDVVRKYRTRILKVLWMSLMAKLSGHQITNGAFSGMGDHITGIIDVVQIDQIDDMEAELAVRMVNRPILEQEE